MADDQQQTTMEVIADIAEAANGIAALCVGHRKILVEGQFPEDLADAMCQALHAKLLGLDIWNDVDVDIHWPDEDLDDDDDE